MNSILEKHLRSIYPKHNFLQLAQKIETIFPQINTKERDYQQLWDETDILLISYADTINNPKEKPLKVLKRFLDSHLKNTATLLHILPFFPFSSDDGFAVTDYEEVRSELGDWNNITDLSKSYKLMADVVINHTSSNHSWFQQFCSGTTPGKNYYKTENPKTNLSMVVRPRSNDLLQLKKTKLGNKYLWCTFSPDQVDLDFSNPDVLIEFLQIFKKYINYGIRIFRLDAVGYIWKEVGTKCINLPQAHEIIKLVRLLTDSLEENIILVTETNVPSQENLEYFGNGNEAHIIYNFSLPPLILHALLTGESKWLRHWMMGMPPSSRNCTYLNFTASHDGIGLRPLEGILPQLEIESIVSTVQKFGGRLTFRKHFGKDIPYEINSTFYDALKGTTRGVDKLQSKRFIASQMIMIALAGIPAIYLNSFFSAKNDTYLANKTQNNRSINRSKWSIEELEATLNDRNSPESFVFKYLLHALNIKKKQSAFHPNATQFTLHLNPGLFGFWRQSIDQKQSLFAITNLTSECVDLQLGDLNLFSYAKWVELLTDCSVDRNFEYNMAPYQTIWITNRS
ncbi:MAG: alpha-amylase [Proteobacteria bacterium]|nr:alpha-amylase [Pseudomonadota bacterium]